MKMVKKRGGRRRRRKRHVQTVNHKQARLKTEKERRRKKVWDEKTFFKTWKPKTASRTYFIPCPRKAFSLLPKKHRFLPPFRFSRDEENWRDFFPSVPKEKEGENRRHSSILPSLLPQNWVLLRIRPPSPSFFPSSSPPSSVSPDAAFPHPTTNPPLGWAAVVFGSPPLSLISPLFSLPPSSEQKWVLFDFWVSFSHFGGNTRSLSALREEGEEGRGVMEKLREN